MHAKNSQAWPSIGRHSTLNGGYWYMTTNGSGLADKTLQPGVMFTPLWAVHTHTHIFPAFSLTPLLLILFFSLHLHHHSSPSHYNFYSQLSPYWLTYLHSLWPAGTAENANLFISLVGLNPSIAPTVLNIKSKILHNQQRPGQPGLPNIPSPFSCFLHLCLILTRLPVPLGHPPCCSLFVEPSSLSSLPS